MSLLLRRYEGLPRVARWGVWGVAAVVLYFAVVEPVIDRVNRYASLADARQATLEAYERSAGTLRAAGETTALGQRRHGVVEMPGDPESRPLAFNQAVDEVLKKHGVGEQRTTSRTVPLGTGPLTLKVGAEYRVDRLMKDIEFQAEPEVVAAVIADLERTPVVAAVTRVQVRQAEDREKGGRRVRVSLGVEAWQIVRKTG